MPFVASIIASLMAIIFIKPSFAVTGLRRKNKVGLGAGGHEDLERAIRPQGNFA
ncbi:hypothetical protein [Polynucleobacter sp. MWH-Braz-FAM2G]|uniref:hypothetical protein n=1 Tax=Polynucleobacter sp. MWH-Braz-FAM2G TaxID=1855883 RepID=UPI001BFD5124|nr:hypothetical protein [Polynucleobacter sp. MWH-Braz-FAM2G]QWD90742.1 hypothetical protein FD973_10845 [Polynucleobacter sp. MWH-Braz-FAM2G]